MRLGFGRRSLPEPSMKGHAMILFLQLVFVVSAVVCIAGMMSKTVDDKKGLFGLGAFLSLLFFGSLLIA